MRAFFACLLLPLFACADEGSNPLTKSDWTNGLQPCSENRLSFRDGRIAYYPNGSPPLVMFEIEEIAVDPGDGSLTSVVTRPAKLALDGARQGGVVVPANFRAMWRFRVVDGRLRLLGYADADGSNRRTASAEVQYIFDLIRCAN